MSATPSQDVPTFHLAGVAFFYSPTKTIRQPSAARPVPPTPRKMMHRAPDILDTPPKTSRRRSDVSAIPRPSSGSSRRASPSNLRNKPLPKLPRSESMLPYTQRHLDDLTGIRQQLPVRQYATKTLASPADIQQAAKMHVPPPLPKSATSASLTSRLTSRKLTPGRRLLGPIHPPLPQSQSAGNLPAQSPESEVCISDAIRESRMTQDEIDVLNQVQKEAMLNQNRLRSKFGSPPQSPRDSLTEMNNAATPRSQSVKFVDPTFDKNFVGTSQGAHLSTAASKTHDGTVEQVLINPKHVYFEQDVAYWTGRYITICDRLRGEAMKFCLKEGTSMTQSPESESSSSYELRERQRMRSALYELRSYCKTEKARISFEGFEQQLKHHGGRSTLSISSSAQSMSDPDDQVTIEQASTRVHRNMQRKALEQTRAVAKTVAPLAARYPKPQIPLPNIWGRLALTKSKTTGNMDSLVSEVDSPSQRNQFARPVIPWHHRRKSSTQSVSIPAAVIEDEVQSSQMPASHKRQTSTITVSSVGSTKAGSASEAEIPRRPPPCHYRVPSGSVGNFDELQVGITVASLDTGHPTAPSRPPTNVKSPPSPDTRPIMVDGEKFIGSRREKQRRSSGEAMKGLWQAGVGQVKKMGRRVGGSGSWGLGSEHVDTIVSDNNG